MIDLIANRKLLYPKNCHKKRWKLIYMSKKNCYKLKIIWSMTLHSEALDTSINWRKNSNITSHQQAVNFWGMSRNNTVHLWPRVKESANSEYRNKCKWWLTIWAGRANNKTMTNLILDLLYSTLSFLNEKQLWIIIFNNLMVFKLRSK